MAATGQTTNYKLPMYNAGDTVSDLGSFNQAMQLIDTGMEKNRITGQQQKDLITGLTTQVEKAQGDITALQESVTQANANAVGSLNQIQEIVNPDVVVFTPMTNVSVLANGYRNDSLIQIPNSFKMLVNTGLQTTITVGGATYYVAGKIDNANPYRLPAGTNFGFGTMSWFRRKSDSQVEFPQLMTACIHYDGVNSYFLISSDLSFNPDNYDQTIVKVYDDIKLFNSQPKEV